MPFQTISTYSLLFYNYIYIPNTKDVEEFKQKSDKVTSWLRDILRAVGHEKIVSIDKRNAVENEVQERKRKINDIQMLLHDKEKELNRIHEHYDSLLSVLSKQEKEMDKIRGF